MLIQELLLYEWMCRDTEKGTETDVRSAGSTPPLTDNNGARGGDAVHFSVQWSIF
jgi:hypothetical protein